MDEFKGKVALVVDDEQDNIDFISQILEDHGFQTFSAKNGKEALTKVVERKPDIVFLDLMMPEQSGMAFFNSFKRQEDFKRVPVIVVSGASKVTGVDMKAYIYDNARSEKKKKVVGIDAKPDAFVEKPVNPEALIETVKKVLS